MPNIKSAIKRVRIHERRRMRNRSVRSAVRTYVKTAERSITSANVDVPTTTAATARALKELDSAASKGVLHKNNAARRKSRLMKKLNQAQATASS
ncbi:MAG TPA: 30S ribosomal protein S20 [Chloroflexota bacterium]|nr:30S ribosomal protein S20 [Chloroflexota bacterium]